MNVNVVDLAIGTSVAMLQCCVASALLCLLWFPVGLPAGSPEPRSNISANIRAVKKLGTALERARRAAFKSVQGQR
jgi:hypothetical protein